MPHGCVVVPAVAVAKCAAGGASVVPRDRRQPRQRDGRSGRVRRPACLLPSDARWTTKQTTPLRTPTAAEYETQIRDQIAAARKEIFERAQLEQTEGKARFMESMDTLKQTARMNAEREAEARAATVETRDELRRLNTVTAHLGHPTRTH